MAQSDTVVIIFLSHLHECYVWGDKTGMSTSVCCFPCNTVDMLRQWVQLLFDQIQKLCTLTLTEYANSHNINGDGSMAEVMDHQLTGQSPTFHVSHTLQAQHIRSQLSPGKRDMDLHHQNNPSPIPPWGQSSHATSVESLLVTNSNTIASYSEIQCSVKAVSTSGDARE